MDPKGLPLIISSAVVTGLAVAATSAPADFARTRFMTSKDPVYKRCAHAVTTVCFLCTVGLR